MKRTSSSFIRGGVYNPVAKKPQNPRLKRVIHDWTMPRVAFGVRNGSIILIFFSRCTLYEKNGFTPQFAAATWMRGKGVAVN